MRYFPGDSEYDQEELRELNAEPWQVELLRCNPSYTSWGPREDYMFVRGTDEGPDELGREPRGGWSSRILNDSWGEFEVELDDLNEVVNFYFEITRASTTCETCNGNGYHPDAQWISESFYEHSTPFRAATAREHESMLFMAGFSGSLPKGPVVGKADGNFPSEETLSKYGQLFRDFCDAMASGTGSWRESLTEDDYDALRVQERRWDGSMGHDAINKSIMVRSRCERFGVPVDCPRCNGNGYQFTAPAATVNLILWLLHPRKGASRGVEIRNINQSDLPAIREFLSKAAKRNADRFAGVVMLPETV